MNASSSIGTSLAAALLGCMTLLPVTASADACNPRVSDSPTKFPINSQLRGQRGTVLVAVTIDESGRASTVELDRSSGHRLLDRAATQSIANDWRFDITGCERKDLPVKHAVAVEYRNDEY